MEQSEIDVKQFLRMRKNGKKVFLKSFLRRTSLNSKMFYSPDREKLERYFCKISSNSFIHLVQLHCVSYFAGSQVN